MSEVLVDVKNLKKILLVLKDLCIPLRAAVRQSRVSRLSVS